jgi:hypothetical protein
VGETLRELVTETVRVSVNEAVRESVGKAVCDRVERLSERVTVSEIDSDFDSDD